MTTPTATRTLRRTTYIQTLRTLLLAAAAALCCAALPADGIGPQLRIIPGISTEDGRFLAAGAACSMKFDRIPFYIAVSTDFDFLSGSFDVSAAADYWILNPRISDCWKWFFGVGLMAGASFSGSSVSVGAAPRAFFGMSWIFFDGYFELYAQQGVQPEVRAVFGQDSGMQVPIRFPSDVGVRFWF
ncbi:MAG: hypothetical protein K2H09_01545 [Treponemataceae bacterium]|nr:hypothetical protein [Treponemataceae bacterium]